MLQLPFYLPYMHQTQKQSSLIVFMGCHHALSSDSVVFFFVCVALPFQPSIIHWEQKYQIPSEHFHFKDGRC